MTSTLTTNRVIQGLWIGPELSTMERLSISSFLRNGHEYHLYTYGDVNNIPEGATIKEGEEILPASMIFQYKKHKSFAGFSNYFRYKLLLEKGGWWADTDTVCIRPFDFRQEHVFSSELANGKEFINCGVMKTPRGSPAMRDAWNTCSKKKTQDLVWGEVGPRLLAASIKNLSLETFVMKFSVFCPFGYSQWDEVLNPKRVWNFNDRTYAVHLWNEMWRRNERDKDQVYHPACLYEQLKKEYLGKPDLITSDAKA